VFSSSSFKVDMRLVITVARCCWGPLITFDMTGVSTNPSFPSGVMGTSCCIVLSVLVGGSGSTLFTICLLANADPVLCCSSNGFFVLFILLSNLERSCWLPEPLPGPLSEYGDLAIGVGYGIWLWFLSSSGYRTFPEEIC